MQISFEEQRLYGAKSEINIGVFRRNLEDCREADERQKKHKK